MYKFTFYHPAFMDMDDPPEFYFNNKEELLNNNEIKRVSNIEDHARWEQITEPGKQSTLMSIWKEKNGESFLVKGFITPSLKEQMFPEWKYENYRKEK
jgi:hypothetical protein